MTGDGRQPERQRPEAGQPAKGPPARVSLGARLGRALGRAVGTTVRSIKKGDGPVQNAGRTRELDRTTEEVETRDDEGRTVVLRRTTIDEVEIKP